MIVGVAAGIALRGPIKSRLRALLGRGERPQVAWVTGSPREAGLDPVALDAWVAALGARSTQALLVARGDRLVLEWYPEGTSVNRRQGLAAAAKGIVASLLVLQALQDGLVKLDTPVSSLVVEWAGDPVREPISLRELGTHTSGMEDVPFLGDAGAHHTEPWKRTYEADPTVRYQLAIERAAITQAPGTSYQYSGVGYHPLSVALSRAYARQGQPDLSAVLEQRVLGPLGVPPAAWQISYGQVYSYKGERVYSIGSGASLTPRAVARIGQLMLDRGAFDGSQLFDAASVDDLLTSPQGGAGAARLGEGAPTAAFGWYRNTGRFFPSVPEDAFLAAGAGHRVLLVVPSLELVLVRLGQSLDDTFIGPDSWIALEEQIFAPLMAALGEPGP